LPPCWPPAPPLAGRDRRDGSHRRGRSHLASACLLAVESHGRAGAQQFQSHPTAAACPCRPHLPALEVKLDGRFPSMSIPKTGDNPDRFPHPSSPRGKFSSRGSKCSRTCRHPGPCRLRLPAAGRSPSCAKQHRTEEVAAPALGAKPADEQLWGVRPPKGSLRVD